MISTLWLDLLNEAFFSMKLCGMCRYYSEVVQQFCDSSHSHLQRHRSAHCLILVLFIMANIFLLNNLRDIWRFSQQE